MNKIKIIVLALALVGAVAVIATRHRATADAGGEWRKASMTWESAAKHFESVGMQALNAAEESQAIARTAIEQRAEGWKAYNDLAGAFNRLLEEYAPEGKIVRVGTNDYKVAKFNDRKFLESKQERTNDPPR